MPSASQRSLATVPQDIQYQLLNSLSDFKDLAAVVLTARPLHNAFKTHRRKVLSSVGRNFLGSLFTDALLLARCQEKRDGSDALKVKGLSSSTVRLLVNNADALAELQTIVFGLLKDENLVDINRKPTLTRFAESPPVVIPSETESLRFKFAAYRFCVYCLLQPSGRLAFLNRYPTIQILELAHFVNGLYTLIHVIRGRPPAADEQCAGRRGERPVDGAAQRAAALGNETEQGVGIQGRAETGGRVPGHGGRLYG
ncbi:hypothetical protein C8R44DRAFT_223156 [Mycena epipterygia]|nr:hypothetical protein C8R44DRAFT_223156 [Mycena epipterygia]